MENFSCNSAEFCDVKSSNFTYAKLTAPNSKEIVLNALSLVGFSLYAISGASAVICSVLIIVTVYFHKELHAKEFYLLAGLAGGDLMRGYAYLHCGILRVVLVVTGEEGDQVTRQSCLAQFYHAFLYLGQQSSSTIVLMIAVDRLLAVYLFDKYRNFGVRYALTIVAVVYAVSFIVSGSLWLNVLYFSPRNTLVARVCKSEIITTANFFAVLCAARFFPGVLTPFFYAATIWLLKSKSLGGSMSDSDKKRQYQLTKNVTIIIFINLLFNTLPFGYSFFSAINNSLSSFTYATVSMFTISLSLFGAASNFFLYSFKYPKFQAAVSKSLGLKVFASTSRVMLVAATKTSGKGEKVTPMGR